MKMVRKLKFIVIPLVLLPFCLIFISIIAAGNSYLITVYGDNAGISDIETLGNPVQTVNILTSEVYGQLKATASADVGKLEDKDYLAEINASLEESNSYIVVRTGEELTYIGSTRFDEALVDKLPDYWNNTTEVDGGIYIYDPDSYYIKQVNFLTEDNQEASVFIVTYLGGVIPQFRHIVFRLILAIAAVLVMVSMFISWYMYWQFIRPINALKRGTNYIKEGNLDQDVEVLNDDEIGDLCQSFNEMRYKLKESVEARIQYEQENRELISNISHDLKTPITAIKGYVEGIMDGVADTPEKMERYIKTIYNKANELDVLINELSMYSRIDNNAIPYNFRRVDINSYFVDCIEDIQLQLESKNIELAYFNYCESSIKVVMDPEQIRRVVGNVIMNTIKYNDKQKGHINIRLREKDDLVEIEIEDNGKGIGECELPCIFNRMYRADSSRNSAQGGSGLGLSIAKKIIEEHGGTIWANSKLGVGTTICFTLKKYKEKSDE